MTILFGALLFGRYSSPTKPHKSQKLLPQLTRDTHTRETASQHSTPQHSTTNLVQHCYKLRLQAPPSTARTTIVTTTILCTEPLQPRPKELSLQPQQWLNFGCFTRPLRGKQTRVVVVVVFVVVLALQVLDRSDDVVALPIAYVHICVEKEQGREAS